MFALRLNARACLSCGICMDVCPPRAISMRTASRKRVEGARLTLPLLGSFGEPSSELASMMTFPYLAIPEQCDGCGLCVQQCPVPALELLGEASGELREVSSEVVMT
jgi:ferredoxin